MTEARGLQGLPTRSCSTSCGEHCHIEHHKELMASYCAAHDLSVDDGNDAEIEAKRKAALEEELEKAFEYSEAMYSKASEGERGEGDETLTNAIGRHPDQLTPARSFDTPLCTTAERPAARSSTATERQLVLMVPPTRHSAGRGVWAERRIGALVTCTRGVCITFEVHLNINLIRSSSGGWKGRGRTRGAGTARSSC